MPGEMHIGRPRRAPSAIVLIGLLAMLPCSLRAAQLDEEACTKLKEEHAALVTRGVRSSLERGPEWARANAGPELMKDIARLIEVEEQVLFRCPQPKPTAPPKDEAADTETEQPKKEAAKPKAKSAARDPSKAQPGAAAQAKEGASPAAAKASAAPKPKPKPKAGDAYVPPAKPQQ